MSGYEEEHGIERADTTAPTHSRRPDLSTFFSTLDLIDTSGASGRGQNTTHAEPLPSDVASAFRQLANSYQITLGETEGVTLDGSHPGISATTTTASTQNSAFLEGLIEMLMNTANDPPRRPHGMPDAFFDELERIPKAELPPHDNCPICAVPFVDDKFPLVVRLPCHRDHIFDMDCIRPWLKLQTTCPMCRQDLEKKKQQQPVVPPPAADEEEEEWDEMYA